MQELNCIVNGKNVSIMIDPSHTLADVLRADLGLTGTKKGCEEGECGACTVLIDGVAVNSCLIPAMKATGKNILTIEGLINDDELDPIQEAFIEAGAIQCGFCTPGMVMSAKALLDETGNPTEDDIKESIEGNLCRCTGYVNIIDAIKSVADRR